MMTLNLQSKRPSLPISIILKRSNNKCEHEVENLNEKITSCINTLKQNPRLNQRWVAIGNTDLEKGILSLQRAIR